MTQVRIFGGLQVSGPTGEIPIGSRQERSLLALLIVHRGASLSTGRLVDLLWPDQAPATAAKIVQIHVGRLRAALGGPAIERLADGYVLGRSVVVDADRFEARVSEGLATARDDPLVALHRLETALRETVGEPFATELALKDLQVATSRLVELRWQATERLFDLLLTVGRTDRILADLPPLVAAEPIREALWATWIRTLDAAGRRTQALLACDAARAALRAELDVEPGRELLELERALAEGAPLESPRLVPPFETVMPSQSDAFIGRDCILTELVERSRPGGERIVTLTGPGGVGKTRLALEVGRRLVAAFDGAVAFIDLGSVTGGAQLWPTVAAALEIRAPVPGALRDRRALLVLDNTERLGYGADALHALMEAAPRLQLIVAARTPLHLSGEEVVLVDPLDPADGLALFRERARSAGAPVEAPDVAEAICDRLDGLPLAIELAARQARAMPGPDLVRSLDSRLAVLVDSGSTGPRRHRTIEAAISWSYALLPASAQQLFRRLATFRGGWTVRAAEAICGATPADLRVLVDHSLIRRSGNRTAMLDTIAEYSSALLDASGERSDTLARHADFFLAEAHRQSELVSDEGQFHVLSDDIENQRVAMAALCDEPATDRAADLALTLWMSWMSEGRVAEGAMWFRRALARPSIPDGPGFAFRLAVWGDLARWSGDVDGAQQIDFRAVDVARRNSERATEAAALVSLAGIARFRGDLGLARRHAEQALSLRRELGDESGIIHASLDLTDIETEEGNLDTAADLIRPGLGFIEREGRFSRATGPFAVFVPLRLGRIEFLRGTFAVAAALVADGTEAAHRLNMAGPLCEGLTLAAAVLTERAPDDAVRLLGQASAIRTRTGYMDDAIRERASIERGLVEALGDEREQAVRSEGAAMTIDDAVALALSRLRDVHA
jgi:predicted ATPase/DNA-binding SARP family transcriptional activator